MTEPTTAAVAAVAQREPTGDALVNRTEDQTPEEENPQEREGVKTQLRKRFAYQQVGCYRMSEMDVI
ncbi:unnamed protein product [Peniophora sp. CBMAI 1063]|nr:unnamed protein product [Peniophora sp. CBMAI 1063]